MKTHHFVFDKKKWIKPIDSSFDSPNNLVIVFADDQQALAELQASLPQCKIIGASTYSSISKGQVFRKSLVGTVIQLEQSRFKIAGPYKTSDVHSDKLAKRIVAELDAPDLSGILAFICMNGQEFEFVRGAREALKKNIPFIGGTAGHPDHSTFEGTYVIDDKGIHEKSVIAVGFYGANFSMHSQAESGLKPIGAPGVVTKSENNKVFTIDGRSIVAYYASNLGFPEKDFFRTILQFPLEITHVGESISQIVSPIHVFDEEEAILFSLPIKEGTQVRICMGKKEDLVLGAKTASQKLLQQIEQSNIQNGLLLTTSCGARHLILGDEVEDEHEAVDAGLLKKSEAWLGAHMFGEITHSKILGTSYQNETINLVFMSEKKVA